MYPVPGVCYFSFMKIIRLWAVLFCLAPLAIAAQDAETLYNEGVKLKEQKKVREALEKFKKAVSLKPDYSQAWYESGWCQNDLKDYKGAIISLRNARVGWPNIPKVWFELGYAFHKTDNIDSATYMYNRCLELKPDYSNAFKQLGFIAYDADESKKALEYFAKFEGAAKSEITDYLYWYRKGFCLNATKDYTGAITALQRSLELKKDYLNTYLELGFANTRLKNADLAISYFQQAMNLDPKSHVPYNGIGEVYRDIKKDMNEAMNWYRKTLTVKENERKACFGIGFCLNAQGKYAEAIPYLETAIKQEATYTAAYQEIGYSYYRTGDYEKGLSNLKKALELNPKNENARYYAVLVYVKQKNKAQAQKMVDELKALSSKYVAELQKMVDNM